MNRFEEANKILIERFSKDSLIAVATMDGKRIYNRIVDTVYHDGAFYISTHALSNKAKQMESNSEVAVAAVDWFSGHGIGKNLGWVLDSKNAEVRAIIRKAFVWYDEVNNEQDTNCCFLEIKLTDGILIKDHHAVRYQINFTNKTALVSENFGEFK